MGNKARGGMLPTEQGATLAITEPEGGKVRKGRDGAPDLTIGEHRFASAVARGIDPVDAAQSAGYGGDPALVAYTLLGRSRVREALKIRALRHVYGSLLPKALRAHEQILDDMAATPSARIAAVRLVYDMSGMSGEAADKDTAESGKPVSEWTSDELTEALERAQSALGVLEYRALDVTPGKTEERANDAGADTA